MYIATEEDRYQNSIRYQLVQIVQAFLEQPKQEEANQKLYSIYRKFNEEFHLLYLENIVFRPTVKHLTSDYVQSDAQVLTVIKNQLLGRMPYWNTYAFKHNLVELLENDALEAYHILKKLLTIRLEQKNSTSTSKDNLEEYQNLLNSLHKLCYHQLNSLTLPQLVISYASHMLLTLPEEGTHFDIEDRFSGLSGSSVELVDVHLKYIENFRQKLEGNTTLFVDIHFLPNGFVLNLR